MNVSKEANAAFMAELQQTDPKRYANLMRNMRLDMRRQRANQEGTQEFAAKMAQWRKAAIRRAKKTGVLPTGWTWCSHCKEPFEPYRTTVETCSSRCAYRLKQSQLRPAA